MEIKDYGRKGLHGIEWHRIARVASITLERRSRSQGLDWIGLDWIGLASMAEGIVGKRFGGYCKLYYIVYLD